MKYTHGFIEYESADMQQLGRVSGAEGPHSGGRYYLCNSKQQRDAEVAAFTKAYPGRSYVLVAVEGFHKTEPGPVRQYVMTEKGLMPA